MRAHTKRDRIHEALELLNEAAHEKQEEVYELLGSKYGHLKSIFDEVAHNGQAAAEQAKKQLVKGLHAEEKMLKETAAELGRKVRKDPWKILGVVALGSLAAGLILGRKH